MFRTARVAKSATTSALCIHLRLADIVPVYRAVYRADIDAIDELVDCLLSCPR